MGNCQAVDTASLVIQHPAGKSEMLFWPIPASHVMKSNPGHYVALLVNTTTTTTTATANPAGGAERSTFRITRVKLLRPTDTLTPGHVYRLISTQEVMKGLVAKNQTKMKQGDVIPEISIQKALSQRVESKADMVGAEAGSRLASAQPEKSSNMNKYEERQRQRSTSSRSKAWQPSLKSISEQTAVLKLTNNKALTLISESARAASHQQYNNKSKSKA